MQRYGHGGKGAAGYLGSGLDSGTESFYGPGTSLSRESLQLRDDGRVTLTVEVPHQFRPRVTGIAVITLPREAFFPNAKFTAVASIPLTPMRKLAVAPETFRGVFNCTTINNTIQGPDPVNALLTPFIR